MRLQLIDNPKKSKELNKLLPLVTEFINKEWGEISEDKVFKTFFSLDTIVLGWEDKHLRLITCANWVQDHTYNKRISYYRVGLSVVAGGANGARGNKHLTKATTILLIRHFLKRYLRGFRIAIRTSDTKVYGSMYGRLSRVIPDYKGINSPSTIDLIIAESASRLIDAEKKFIPEKMLVLSAYDGHNKIIKNNLNAPRYHNSEIVNFFERSLNYYNGDAFIVLATLDINSVVNFLKRRINKNW